MFFPFSYLRIPWCHRISTSAVVKSNLAKRNNPRICKQSTTSGNKLTVLQTVLSSALLVCVFANAIEAQDPTAIPRSPIRDQNRNFKATVRSYWELERQNLVSQQLDYSCGAACLATVAKYFWNDDYGESDFIRLSLKLLSPEEFADRVVNGLNMSDLKGMAEEAGYFSTVGKLTFDQLTKSKIPVVVGITVSGYKHFVVYRGWDGETVYLADPIRGNIQISREEFEEQWQRQLILVLAKRVKTLPANAPLLVKESDKQRGELNANTIRRNFLIQKSGF